MPDHYHVLQLPRECTAAELRTAYVSLAKRFHPDRVSDPVLKEKATVVFQAVAAAWTALSDPVKRREYDRSLSAKDSLPASPTSSTSSPVSPSSSYYSRGSYSNSPIATRSSTPQSPTYSPTYFHPSRYSRAPSPCSVNTRSQHPYYPKSNHEYRPPSYSPTSSLHQMAGQVPDYSATSPRSPLVNSNPLYSNTSRASHGMEGAGWRGGANYSDARSPLREQADYGVSLPPEDCMGSPSRHGPWENHNNGGVNYRQREQNLQQHPDGSISWYSQEVQLEYYSGTPRRSMSPMPPIQVPSHFYPPSRPDPRRSMTLGYPLPSTTRASIPYDHCYPPRETLRVPSPAPLIDVNYSGTVSRTRPVPHGRSMTMPLNPQVQMASPFVRPTFSRSVGLARVPSLGRLNSAY